MNVLASLQLNPEQRASIMKQGGIENIQHAMDDHEADDSVQTAGRKSLRLLMPDFSGVYGALATIPQTFAQELEEHRGELLQECIARDLAAFSPCGVAME